MDATTSWNCQRNCLVVGAWAITIAFAVTASGCRSESGFRFSGRSIPPAGAATAIECPDAQVESNPETLNAPPPQTALSSGEVQYWPLKLEEALQLALSHSRVMRDLGGRVLRQPNTSSTVFDPAISETDPLRGPAAALAAFDASFTTQMFWMYGNLDYDLNLLNVPILGALGESSGSTQTSIGVLQAQLAKTAATGTQFYITDMTLYGRNNLLLPLDGYYTRLAAGFRQPLLQGAGIEFNRIAGPRAQPGMYNGVLIARINTDVTLADFEAGVRDMLFDVEQTYWQLYRAYRDLDARITAREAALQTWQLVQRKLESGATDREQEARAREQYFAFDAQVISARTGMTAPGQGGGPSIPGVLTLERRLRWLMGMPPTDGRLIRPADAPMDVRVAFDWSESLRDALTRRVELRRQRWIIKRRELELIAARNFLHMRLDVNGEYGLSGVGLGLYEHEGILADDLFDGDGQNWRLGLQLATPIGNRIGHTAVRSAELQLARERAIYREQELRASHDLSDAIANVDRAYAVARATFNGFIAAHQQLEEVRKKYDAGLVPLDFLLDAQRRAVEADSAYYQSTVDYTISVSNVYFARGTLLAYDNVYLSEGPWSDDAYASAIKQSRRFAPRILNYVYEVPPPISQGRYAQGVVCPPQKAPPEPTTGAGNAVAEDMSAENAAPPQPLAPNQPQPLSDLRQPAMAPVGAPTPSMSPATPSAEPARLEALERQQPPVSPIVVEIHGSDLQQPAIGQQEKPIRPTTLQLPNSAAGSAEGSHLEQPAISQSDKPIQRTAVEQPARMSAPAQPSALRQPQLHWTETPTRSPAWQQPTISHSEEPIQSKVSRQSDHPSTPSQPTALRQPQIDWTEAPTQSPALQQPAIGQSERSIQRTTLERPSPEIQPQQGSGLKQPSFIMMGAPTFR